MRNRTGQYFATEPGAPAPLSLAVRRRVSFSDCDPMGIAWHGRYPLFFEAASTELNRACGLSFAEFFDAGLRAPIASLHTDFFVPLRLDEDIRITATVVWSEAARLNTQFAIHGQAGNLAAAGCTVQLFTDAATGQVCIATPALLERCRRRWRAGEFRALQ
jgi:acyl-CoA thioester hydrolase